MCIRDRCVCVWARAREFLAKYFGLGLVHFGLGLVHVDLGLGAGDRVRAPDEASATVDTRLNSVANEPGDCRTIAPLVQLSSVTTHHVLHQTVSR